MQRAVVVTGASSGIGEACVGRLARGGWRVFAGVRSAEDGDRLRDADVTPLVLDVTDAEQIAAAAAAVGAELHGLVDNAGVALSAPLELVPLDELRLQLEVNLVGQVAVTQAFLPALRRAHGRIVLMGSIAGRSALPFLGPYAASKFALEAIADSLRVELRPWSIVVSIVEPGSIRTPIWSKGAARADALRAQFAVGADELYGATIERFREVAVKRGLAGIPPDEVAKAVEHALTAARPRSRYLVGRDAKLRARLQRLPTRMRDRLLARMLLGE
jgi:NAD(P)-dependent dehydrogenase (short-subunit alcohol dehydrogenase family)